MKKRFTEEQTIAAVKKLEAGVSVPVSVLCWASQYQQRAIKSE
jgi:hypothetical protein